MEERERKGTTWNDELEWLIDKDPEEGGCDLVDGTMPSFN
jgi:hypothetical protein